MKGHVSCSGASYFLDPAAHFMVAEAPETSAELVVVVVVVFSYH